MFLSIELTKKLNSFTSKTTAVTEEEKKKTKVCDYVYLVIKIELLFVIGNGRTYQVIATGEKEYS